MSDQPVDQAGLTVHRGQALVGVLIEEDGREIVRYFAGDLPAEPQETDRVITAALSLAGAWSDLDWQEMADALDRIRHESRPTPPIEL
jgi:hypothetical protein